MPKKEPKMPRGLIPVSAFAQQALIEGAPRRFFGDFLIAEKVTRRRGGETPPATKAKALSSPPHPPQCAHWGTFPPRGRFRRRRIRTGSVGSAKPGAVVKPHQRQFLQTQGPVARREFRVSLRFCAPEIFAHPKG